MVGLVLDCSATLSWVLADERPPESRTILDWVVEQGAIVPELWVLEVGHTLLIAERRRRLTRVERGQALDNLASLPITADPHTASRAWSDTLHMADIHGLSLYDATYLELALRLDVPLATLDKALARAATKEQVTLIA